MLRFVKRKNFVNLMLHFPTTRRCHNSFFVIPGKQSATRNDDFDGAFLHCDTVYIGGIILVGILSGVYERRMPSFRILALKVLGWMPRIAAAPSFPSMRHLVSERILRIWFRSVSSNVLKADEIRGVEVSSLSANSKTGPEHKITARSMILSSSRTLPGQSYFWRTFMVAFDTVSIFFPVFLLNLSMKCSTRTGRSSLRWRSGGTVMGKTLSR